MKCDYTITAEEQKVQFNVCVGSHALMFLIALLTTGLTIAGRDENRKGNTRERPNAFLMFALYTDMASAFLYLIYSMFLQHKIQRIQLCMYDEKY